MTALQITLTGAVGAGWDQWKGPWSSATVYVRNDTVQFDGSIWVAKLTNNNKSPATNPTEWDTGVAAPVTSKYAGATPASVAGVLTLDCALYTSFLVTLTENITSIVFLNPPLSSQSQRLAVYYKQGSGGGKTVEPPAGAYGTDGSSPVVNPAANTTSLVIYDLFEGFVFATLVHNNYRLIP